MIQTPSAISSGAAAPSLVPTRDARLNSLNARASAGEPSAGIIPIWRANAIESLNASLATIRSSSICRTSQPSSSRRAPLGSSPLNGVSPQNVPVARQRTAARPLSTTMSCTCRSRSGTAPNSAVKKPRTPSGAVVSTWPRMNSRPPGFQNPTIASTSRSAIASK